jgi:hypothetical protein
MDLVRVGTTKNCEDCGGEDDSSLGNNIKKRTRIPDIDFWRGVLLIMILIDHVPGCILEHFTLRNFGFSDAAEGFFFLSGVSVGLAYVPRFDKGGFRLVFTGCVARAAKIYWVHIAVTVAGLLVVAFVVASANQIATTGQLYEFATAQGFSRFIKSPLPSLIDIMLLKYQLAFFPVLVLYVIFFLWAPFGLALAVWDVRAALLVSAGVYAAGRAPAVPSGWRLEPGDLFFNPIAWQLVFTIGIVCAVSWRAGLLRPSPQLVKLSAAIVLASGIIVIISTYAVHDFTAEHAALSRYLDISKPDLGLVRLVHFLALAYLIAAATVTPNLVSSIQQLINCRFGRSLQGMGRNSLAIFAAGSLLALVGRAVIWASKLETSGTFVRLIGVTYALIAVGALFAISHRIERGRLARVSSELGTGEAFAAFWWDRASMVARRLSIIPPPQ